MASKRRNMFQKNKTQETTENVSAYLDECQAGAPWDLHSWLSSGAFLSKLTSAVLLATCGLLLVNGWVIVERPLPEAAFRDTIRFHHQFVAGLVSLKVDGAHIIRDLLSLPGGPGISFRAVRGHTCSDNLAHRPAGVPDITSRLGFTKNTEKRYSYRDLSSIAVSLLVRNDFRYSPYRDSRDELQLHNRTAENGD
ncbi:hypothetical protein AAG570_011419 [Ranatra chinensis]|uniref:Uncharacterized protein n=1 Tax=Ranatra chinensis TaxID=642074 RepID=A0ABD0YKQ3_9HEMI